MADAIFNYDARFENLVGYAIMNGLCPIEYLMVFAHPIQ